jgi:hypothetical protein
MLSLETTQGFSGLTQLSELRKSWLFFYLAEESGIQRISAGNMADLHSQSFKQSSDGLKVKIDGSPEETKMSAFLNTDVLYCSQLCDRESTGETNIKEWALETEWCFVLSIVVSQYYSETKGRWEQGTFKSCHGIMSCHTSPLLHCSMPYSKWPHH